jgi:hypothetical protein
MLGEHLSPGCHWSWPADRAREAARRSSCGVVRAARLAALRLVQCAAAPAIALSFFFDGTLIAHAESARVPPAWTAGVVAATDAGRDVCATLTDGVRVRIEKLKTLSSAWTAKIRTGQGNDTSDKMRDERRTIKDLNAMLTGIGCKPLDIEFELAQPPKPVPPAPAAKLKIGGHHHKS